MISRYGLAATFLAKCVLTCFWVGACWLSVDLLSWLGVVPVPEPLMFLRLLGMAYAALLIGYWIGFCQAWRGLKPTATVAVGIVSNAGACGWLLYFWAVGGSWSSWEGIAYWFMLLSVVALMIVTIGLIVCGGRDLWKDRGRLFGCRTAEE